ncbi:hypothetical protein KTJ62_18875, partial [Acinetobacter sp. WU_MDCI_Abxa265]|uniref:hypothetical protein n=1 Tax=unclassified Acinetobacter TaxID=196816 RepID=UPI001BB2CC1C
TENREQRTENREQRTENREQRTENREQSLFKQAQILETFELKFKYIKTKKFLLSVRLEEIFFNIWDIFKA